MSRQNVGKYMLYIRCAGIYFWCRYMFYIPSKVYISEPRQIPPPNGSHTLVSGYHRGGRAKPDNNGLHHGVSGTAARAGAAAQRIRGEG